ncbi:MAG: exodeoxyribonuclease VII small subunit, partial [Paludibacteraceae bacterium]|nr:exodeoxyribonuclease VII small subunit [Paludibacteraceae bacterium]
CMMYDDALKRLEGILNEVKGGDLPLGQLTSKIKEAQELVTFCRTYLSKTEKEVDTLVGK